MSVRLTLKGFGSMLRQLEKAGGNVEKTSKDVLLKSAKMFALELTKQTNSAPISVDTKKAIMKDFIKPQIVSANQYFVVAETGFRMGEYNSNPTKENPLSGGFIAQFNNYGTDQRFTKSGDYRGSLDKLEFVQRTHKAVDSKIRKMQEKELNNAMQEAFK